MGVSKVNERDWGREERGREGGREGGRDRGREEGREEGREGGREGGRETLKSGIHERENGGELRHV